MNRCSLARLLFTWTPAEYQLKAARDSLGFLFWFLRFYFLFGFYLLTNAVFYYPRLDPRVSQVQWARPGHSALVVVACSTWLAAAEYKFQLTAAPHFRLPAVAAAADLGLAQANERLLSRCCCWLIKAVGLAPLIHFVFETTVFDCWLWQWILEWKSSWQVEKLVRMAGLLLFSANECAEWRRLTNCQGRFLIEFSTPSEN